MEEVLRDCYLCERSLQAADFHNKRRECKDCSKGMKLTYRYGISMQEYEQLLEQQNGVCAICVRGPEEVGVLAVDHDHRCCPTEKTCGKCIRSLLCTDCNISIGRFNDDVERLERAAEYLKSFA
jgi:hypothetical protein